MPDTSSPPKIVFLHIPKTAGQTVHTQLAWMVGAKNVSPVRVHTQAETGRAQMPEGYALYSGHLDWTCLEEITPRFTFTVLRDPRERVASFYFFLRAEAEREHAAGGISPRNVGKQNALNLSTDEYFMGGDAGWQRFVHDHYDNFYCAYLGNRVMRGYRQIAELDTEARVARALANVPLIDRVYSTKDLGALEADIADRFGREINVVGSRKNVGPVEEGQSRWDALMERLETAEARARLESFVADDLVLLERMGIEI